MKIRKKIDGFLQNRNKLDIFLIKAGGLLIAYYGLRIIIKFTPLIRPIFLFFRNLLTQLILKSSYFILDTLGYEVNIYNRIIWIEGSQGVRVINACLGWSIMALFIGFIIIYPGKKKNKYWFIPLGIVSIIFANTFRITAMAMVSFHRYSMMDFYHKNIFNLILYLVVFGMWIIWVRKYGLKE